MTQSLRRKTKSLRKVIMEGFIIFVLIAIIAVLGTFAGFYKGRSMSYNDNMRINERYMKAAINENAAKLETAMYKKITPKVIAINVAHEIQKRSKVQDNEYMNQDFGWDVNEYGADEHLELDSDTANKIRNQAIEEENAHYYYKEQEKPYLAASIQNENASKPLPNRIENAAKSLSERMENASKTLIEHFEIPSIKIGKGERIYVKNPKVGSPFYGQNKIEINPLTPVIHYYRRVEAGFMEIGQIEIFNLEKGKTKKVAHNNPLVLLCGYETCHNVILISPNAHNAKYCGCEDCTKF